MSLSARVFTIAFSLFILLAFPVVSFAQSNYASQPTLADAQQESFKIQRILAGFGQVIICQLSGRDVFRPGYDCAGQKVEKTQSSRQQSNGILGMTLGGIASMYQPPLTTLDSIRYFAGNFGIAKPVLAQDEELGSFQSFSFLQNMHVTIRNISYMLLVIVFIFIGIAIMLRFKIDPRTVMSIQNQIPKIIIGVVMITFSYAIAGLLVDGMWVLTYFGINTIGNIAQLECTGGNGQTLSGIATQRLLNNPMAFTRDMFSDAGCFGSLDGISGLSKDVGSAMGGALSNTILETVGLDAPSAHDCNSSLLHPDVTDCIQAGIYSFMAFLIGIVAFIIVLFAIIIALVRLWFTLIKAYVYILLDIVTAPIQILMGIFPGGKMGFGKWLRHISAYLLIFPASATLIMLAVAFALNKNLNQHSADPNATFYPPLIGIPGLTGNMGALIAFGLIMITPELLEMIKDALQVKNSDRATKAISGGFMRGVGPTQVIGGGVGGLFKGKDGQRSPAGLFGSMAKGIITKKFTNPQGFINRNSRLTNKISGATSKLSSFKKGLTTQSIQTPMRSLFNEDGTISSLSTSRTKLGQAVDSMKKPRLGRLSIASIASPLKLPGLIHKGFRKTQTMYEEEKNKSIPSVRSSTQGVAARSYYNNMKTLNPLTSDAAILEAITRLRTTLGESTITNQSLITNINTLMHSTGDGRDYHTLDGREQKQMIGKYLASASAKQAWMSTRRNDKQGADGARLRAFAENYADPLA